MRVLTRFGLVAVLGLTVAACSNSPSNPLAPSAAGGGIPSAVPEGSPTLKVTAPANPQPGSGVVLEGRDAPVLSVANATTRFAGDVPLGTRFQLFEGDTLLAEPIVGAGPDGRSAWQYGQQLKYATTYRWRARAEFGDAYGPWSNQWEFRTADEPIVQVGFPVPPECGPIPNPTSDRTPCLLAVVRVSPHWPACQGGSGVSCHRFTRDVARALAAGDPRWGLIGKNPGETQCTFDRCGGLNGEGYGEDVVAYLPDTDIFRWIGFDIVLGAGRPGASVAWQGPLPRRAGNYWAPVPKN